MTEDIQPSTKTTSERSPSLFDVFLPIGVLALTLLGLINLFSHNAGGYTPLALILAAATACLVGLKNGIGWHQMEQGMVATVSSGLKAILILLTVGALVGSWIAAGTVPAMIYFGTQLLSPEWFYAATALICAVAGLSIGSSWTVAGALGVGLMGVATVIGVSPAITAGAVISGAYLGDKLSPLSDTTNLAAGITDNDLFRHIRHMGWTTIPAFAIALVVYALVGGSETGGDLNTLDEVNQLLQQQFYLGWPVFLPLLLVFGLALKRQPVLPTLLAGIVCGVAVAAIFQADGLAKLAGGDDWIASSKGAAMALMSGYSSATGNEILDDLLKKGGMGGMLSTVFLIICALSFGGAFERAGLLQRAVEGVMSMARGVRWFDQRHPGHQRQYQCGLRRPVCGYCGAGADVQRRLSPEGAARPKPVASGGGLLAP